MAEAFPGTTTRFKPLVKEILGDLETPLSAYWKLAHDSKYSFLLESVTGGERLARYSILGVRPKKVVRTKGTSVRVESAEGAVEQALAPNTDPLHLLKDHLDAMGHVAESFGHFAGGAVGLMSYDIVRFFEKLPDNQSDDLQIDDLAMMLAEAVVVFDHAKNIIRVVVLQDDLDPSAAQAEMDFILSRLDGALPPLPEPTNSEHVVSSNVSQERYEEMVKVMKDYITAGDGVQMVPSQRFETSCDVHPVLVYRALRSLNPSPYMFLLRFGDFDLVGASPELMVSLHGRKAKVRPIAGTRWRGQSIEEDDALAAELLADEKERAEHIMLVDLGRNDLGRVCDWGSVSVDDLMVIERYSHVMHIVSEVTGELRAEMDAYDLVRATFPAGTVSGAPKVRAMQIIDELEPTRRGSYAGAVGLIDLKGDLDTCIVLRTILLKNGKAYVQAGAGVVFDSDPTKEFVETQNKAKAPLKAVEMAKQGIR
jgi:anthranilate synthase component 1